MPMIEYVISTKRIKNYHFKLIASSEGLTNLEFIPFEKELSAPLVENQTIEQKKARQIINEALQELSEYFNQERTYFNIPLSLKGTLFQKDVWNALRKIPYGKVTSYAMIASHIGNPKALRAVGMANQKNPLPILIPCHRIIGKSGHLTGFGGGLNTKQMLLELEGHSINSMKITEGKSWLQKIN